MAAKQPSRRRKVRKKKKGLLSTLILWLIMLALIGAGAAEFVGPHKGWFGPFVSKVEDRIRAYADTSSDSSDDEAIADAGEVPAETDEPDWEAESDDDESHHDPAPVESEPRPQPVEADPTPTRPKPTPQPRKTPAPPMETADTSVAQPDTTDKPKSKEPTTADYRKLYQTFLKEEMAKLKKPQTGKIYTVPTTKYDIHIGKAPTYRGMLMVVANDRVVLRRSDNGQSVTITPDLLSPRWVSILFPRIVARRRAVARLDRVMGRERKPPAVADTKPRPEPKPSTEHSQPVATTPTIKTPTPKPTPKPAPPKTHTNGRLTKYDPTKAKTPTELGPEIRQFGQWLQMQSRRVGGKLANEIYAKQHGRHVVLYMVMHPNYTNQKQDLREVVAEMFWSMWSRRCRESGRVSSLQHAHVVLLDSKGNIIGGSRVRGASDIWVKR